MNKWQTEYEVLRAASSRPGEYEIEYRYMRALETIADVLMREFHANHNSFPCNDACPFCPKEVKL